MLKKHHLRHIHFEDTEKHNLFYYCPRAFVNLILDNGLVYKKVDKSVLFSLISVYNVITKREEHTDELQLSALCVEVAPPPIHFTSF